MNDIFNVHASFSPFFDALDGEARRQKSLELVHILARFTFCFSPWDLDLECGEGNMASDSSTVRICIACRLVLLL